MIYYPDYIRFVIVNKATNKVGEEINLLESVAMHVPLD